MKSGENWPWLSIEFSGSNNRDFPINKGYLVRHLIFINFNGSLLDIDYV